MQWTLPRYSPFIFYYVDAKKLKKHLNYDFFEKKQQKNLGPIFRLRTKSLFFRL